MELSKSNELINQLKSLDLPMEDFAVFASGPMYIHGIKELGHDLDIIARGNAWVKAIQLGSPENKHQGNGSVVALFNGNIEIFNSWTSEEWDINKLIDEAEIIDGIKWVKLEEVLKWKRQMNRPKDAEHIRLIEEYLEKIKASLLQHR